MVNVCPRGLHARRGNRDPRASRLAGACASLLICGLVNVAWGQTEAEAPTPPAPTGSPAASDVPSSAGAASEPTPEHGSQAWQPWPAKAVLLPFEVANVDSEWVDAFETLFREEFEAAHGGRMMPSTETAQALSQLNNPHEVMRACGADVYVAGSLTRLDAKIVISVASFDREGRRLRREKMTAGSLDDLEAVSERLGKALGGNVSAKEVRTLDNITDREAQVPTRVKADDLVGFRGGLTVPVSSVDLNMLITAALDVRFQSERHFVGFAIGLLLPANGEDENRSYGGLTGEVNAAYYLTHTSMAPYLGGGLNARILSGGANLAPYAMFGLMFNRQSGAQAYLELRATQNVTPIAVDVDVAADAVTGVDSTTERVYPFEPSLNAGVGW